ncbi:MAG: LPS export ABC transporter periplasmic protein LptC [Deltaproteobacteria bacterium]|nr:LPS export ABC transporter periplasmic protein LptC [Deltaproteobacteria bacterium]
MHRWSSSGLNRRRVRTVLAVLMVVAVGAVIVQLARSQWAQHLRSLRTRELDFLPQVSQRIQNFRRVKMDGERKVWEVAAREAQYFEEDKQIVVDGPEVSFFVKDDQGVVSVKGKQGKILLDGREMDRVDLEGGIELRFRDYLVQADRAVYQRADDSVVSPGTVRVTGDGLSLSGDRMTLDMGSQRARFEGNVRTVVERTPEEKDANRS